MPEQTLTFPGRRQALAGFLALPERQGPAPALVLIHEVFGLNDNMRQIARDFAAAGYAALAVDLYSGRNRIICMARFFSGLLLKSLDHGAIGDLKAALDWLAARPEVDPERLGAVGFCMGGSFAIAWACTDSRLKAVAPYSAMNPRPAAAVARLCPVVGSFPTNDFSTPHGEKLDALLDRYEVPHDIKLYPATSHSFFNPASRDANPESAADAWRRTVEWLGRYLGD